ncbi:MAG: MBOAT family protein [Kiritimatiellaeota bacterium]|nr:MBOAT family protein [Kiritimatiellota bacterium]
MLFNSLAFLIFLPTVWALYWFVARRSVRLQNALVVAASYVFYGWWDWRFLILIVCSTVWAWALALADARWARGRKARMVLSFVLNLGLLGVFKYFNFFAQEAIALLNALGVQAHPVTLKIILPVGISFYTFQTLSYTIDVYRKQLSPTRDLVAFAAYVSFFPQLVAGPIERAMNLLPQFLTRRTFDYAKAVDGCRQMLWGFFKKMVIADNCAVMVQALVADDVAAPGLAKWLGMSCFAFQVYGDFSGYSDIAIGCSRLFGIHLRRNFAYPYFSRNIAEFWQRWHMSLMTWFRDYLYIPLGGNRVPRWKQVRNTFVVFLFSGLWHGANWTYIVFGLVQGVFFLPFMLMGAHRKHKEIVAADRFLPSPKEVLQMLSTAMLLMLSWPVFRASSITETCRWLKQMFTFAGGFAFALPEACREFGATAAFVAALLCVEWVNRREQHGLARLPRWRWARLAVYWGIVYVIAKHCGAQQTFIYFQF